MKALVAFFLLLVVVITAWFLMSSKPPEADFIIGAGAEVDTLDPQEASWLTDFRVIECMFEPLLTVDTKTLAVAAATSDKWEISEDKSTYTFHIRDTAKWSNGDPVTAHDYIYAWQRGSTPDYNSDYFYLFHYIKGIKAFAEQRKADTAAYVAEKDASKKSEDAARALWKKSQDLWDSTVGLKAKDDRTLVITLEKPVTYFIELVAFSTFCPVHKKTVEPTVTYAADTGLLVRKAEYFSNPATVVCNGPYVLKERSYKQHTLLTANPNYWDRANMGNQSIKVRVLTDPTTAMLEYNAGGVHWLPDIPSASAIAADLVKERDDGKRKDIHTGPGAGTYFYHFNCAPEYPKGKKNVFADPRVRRALSMAVDRKAIVEKVTRLFQPIARTITPLDLGMAGYEPPVEAGITYDPEGARALLAEAGFPDGKGFPQDTVFSYSTEGGGHVLIAQYIQEIWERELKIKINLQGVEKNRAMEIRRAGDFHIARGGWYGDYRDPTTFLDLQKTGNGHNNSKYSNLKYDELLEKASNETDVPKRNALMREAEAIMLAEQPILPIYQYTNFNVYDPEVVFDLNINAWNYRDFAAVKVKKKGK